jgi:cell division protein FtsA
MLPSTTYRSKRQRIVAVLDMGTSKVCCLIARATAAPDWLGEQGPTTQYQVIGIGHQRALGMKSGTVVNMDLAEQAIRSAVDQAELMAGVTVENVLLGVTCGRISSESFQASVAIESAGVRGQDIDRVLAAGRDYATREGRTLLHALATGCHLDGGTKISDPCGMIADRLQVDIHSVAADEAPLRNLMLCVERCHLEVAGLAAAPYASAIASLTPDEAKLGATCIDIGAGTTTIAVFADGEFILADALAMGGHLITLDLAHAFSTPLEDAERIKTLYASAYPTPSDEREVVALPMVGDDDLPQHNKYNQGADRRDHSPAHGRNFRPGARPADGKGIGRLRQPPRRADGRRESAAGPWRLGGKYFGRGGSAWTPTWRGRASRYGRSRFLCGGRTADFFGPLRRRDGVPDRGTGAGHGDGISRPGRPVDQGEFLKRVRMRVANGNKSEGFNQLVQPWQST